jgi:hypothetical protein
MFQNRLIPMSLVPKDFNQRLVREITIILIIKVVILLTIKHIWFDAPTIPKNFDNQVAERIAGSPSQIKETR